MTLVGKILIVINFAMSMLMLSFAFGVYTQRIDFSTAKATPEKAQGELGKRRDRIETQWKSVQTAESRWRGNNKILRRYDKSRPTNLKWYDAELTKLVKGTDPVAGVDYKDGYFVVEKLNKEEDNFGRPLLKPVVDRRGQPLRGMEAYKNGYNVAGMADKVWGFTDYQREIKAEMEKFGKLAKEDTDLSAELGKEKGLRHRLKLEQEKQERIEEEIEYLKPLKYNAEVEAELVLRRREQLEYRKKELLATAPVKVVSK